MGTITRPVVFEPCSGLQDPHWNLPKHHPHFRVIWKMPPLTYTTSYFHQFACILAHGLMIQLMTSILTLLVLRTLSPMASFDSELQTKFSAKLEGAHVINIKKQVWKSGVTCLLWLTTPSSYFLVLFFAKIFAAVIPSCPSNLVSLNATFRNSSCPEFQVRTLSDPENLTNCWSYSPLNFPYLF